MRRNGFITGFLCVVAALTTLEVNAAMGPGRALPQSWNISVNRGYTLLTGLDGNPLSAMCVECHTTNPSAGIFNSILPFGESETLYRGSHFVRNALDGTDRPTANTAIENLLPWAGTTLGKYGDFTNVQSVEAVAGDLICESCHNLVNNKAPGLLLGDYDELSGVSTMCEMCHMDESGGPPEHHPMTGHVVGPDSDNPASHALNVSHTSHVRNPTLDVAKTLSVAIFAVPAPRAMTCVSCHKPHDAMTATGARILRRGASQDSDLAIFEKSINVTYADNVPEPGLPKGTVLVRKPNGVSATGLHRQSDMPAGVNLVFNADPLCSACH